MLNKEKKSYSAGSHRDDRSKIAYIVLLASIVGVFVLSTLIIYKAKDTKTAEYIFGAILPLFAAWVGTILAFYFSKENFEAASRSVQAMVDKISPMEKLASLSVRTKMRNKNSMLYLSITPAIPADKIKLVDDILTLLVKNGRNRLPVLNENGQPVYMIHRSMIDRYLTQKAISDNDLKKLSLQDLLTQDRQTKEIFEAGFVIVDQDSTLADAKSEMEKTPNCLDVFVTQNGTRNEPLIGWLTNLDIAKHAKL